MRMMKIRYLWFVPIPLQYVGGKYYKTRTIRGHANIIYNSLTPFSGLLGQPPPPYGAVQI